MSILKKEYELSVWDEILEENGQKQEIKRIIIGAHDMDYLGRATSLKLSRNINGTNCLTFQLPSKFFDSKIGEYVHNEFCDYLFNEKKLKLQYNGEWFEFYIKNVNENKQFKSIIYQYTCEDSFIDELSRNGYGITFDTELYNNVEEIGNFTNTILEDSIWHYDPSRNIGDFTEYSEEKLFKIPISQFTQISGYKIDYKIKNETMTNVYNNEIRLMEMGDDLAREKKYFWDNGDFDNGFNLISEENLIYNIKNDGYIYIPYNQLDFCYVTEQKDDYAATEVPATATIKGINSYLLSPKTIDPTKLIQFLAIPNEAKINIDENGLLVNKDFHYVMTVAQWNEFVNTNLFYWFEDVKHKRVDNGKPDYIHGNKCIIYDGYLNSINNIEVNFGKAISITDRTEKNISPEIDQYVTVYNNNANKYQDMFSSNEWKGNYNNYRVCSKIDTRQIVPQLARNLIQNGISMTNTDGWSAMIPDLSTMQNSQLTDTAATVNIRSQNIENDISFWLELSASSVSQDLDINEFMYSNINSFVNFGIVGQEVGISNEKVYYFKIKGSLKNNEGLVEQPFIYLNIGEGELDSKGNYILTKTNNYIRIKIQLNTEYLFKFDHPINKPYIVLELEQGQILNISEAWFFEAYTKGIDFFENGYFRYSGRNLGLVNFNIQGLNSSWQHPNSANYSILIGGTDIDYLSNCILFETDIMEGSTYEYRRYFIQQIQFIENGLNKNLDTFSATQYLSDKGSIDKLPLPSYLYTDDDYKIVTNYIDMEKCPYYKGCISENNKIDCECHKNKTGICMYQKYGYCPYLFQTQKHCRKIRTLNGEKSNRFNLTQELSKIFEVYPVYYIGHNANGKIKTRQIIDNDKIYNQMDKTVFYITEKGMENKLGFRYEKNLTNISRTFDSTSIVTKLYVEDIDSELSKTGLCSIKTAEDNPSKDSYIIDFRYYNMKGLLDEEISNRDLYGINEQDQGYLKTLGYYNTEYDKLSNKIINLQDHSYTELVANIEVNLTGIDTALQELNKTRTKMLKYYNNEKTEEEQSQTYQNYQNTLLEQQTILIGLIQDTFFSSQNGLLICSVPQYNISATEEINKVIFTDQAINPLNFLDNITVSQLKDYIYKYHPIECSKYGMIGQYITEYNQIQEWKKEREKYLKKINDLSLKFYQKYEPYLKEGTWSDSNYLSDNCYYFGAKEIAKQGAIPKVNYNITVTDLSTLDEDYTFNIADTTYIEDIETFGINKKTGLPNRLKVIISSIEYDLDLPMQNSITIQNYTTQFEDLFQQISASVQSLSFNENIYKRSSNFTATQNIDSSSLQGTLDSNNLILLNTEENNIELDSTGQSGSDINNHNNKYNLNGQGLFFSNDGGEHWNIGVGPSGINADYIKVGTLDAGKIRIVDNDYLYFLWDKTGITAYREPYSINNENEDITITNFNDFSRFNKYGLSLVENGKIRLRAGYDYYSSYNEHNGLIVKEDDKIINNRDIGFFLYNSIGEKIFSTTSSTILDQEENEESETAKISLKGEIYVTDNTISNTQIQQYYTYSNRYYFDTVSTYTYQAYEPTIKIQNGIVEVDNLDNRYELFLYYYLTNSTPLQELGFQKKYNDGTLSNIYYVKMSDKTPIINLVNGLIDEQYYQNILEQRIFYLLTRTDTDPIIDEDVQYNEITYGIYLNKNTNALYKRMNNRTIYIVKDIEENVQWNANKLITQVNINYYDISESISSLKNISLYWRQTGYEGYSQVEMVTSEQLGKDGETALFINNQLGWTEANGDQRIFCSCRRDKDADQISNLLTIKKNGEFYIGGTLHEKNKNSINLKNLDPEVDIENPILAIVGNEIKMDLFQVEGLMELIASAVGNIVVERHSHPLENATAMIEDTSSEDGQSIKYYYLPKDETEYNQIRQGGQSNQRISINDLSNSELLKLICTGTTSHYVDSTFNPSFSFTGKIPAIGEYYKYIYKDSKTGAYGGFNSNDNIDNFSGYGYIDPIDK